MEPEAPIVVPETNNSLSVTLHELRKILPDNGIGFHGTSYQNYQHILEEGFKAPGESFNYSYYYYLQKKGFFTLPASSNETAREFEQAFQISLERAKEVSYKQNSHPVLLIVSPIQHLGTEKLKRNKRQAQKGLPTHIHDDPANIKLLGQVDYKINHHKLNYIETLGNIVQLLKGER